MKSAGRGSRFRLPAARSRRPGEVSISVREIAAREARNRFGHLLDAVQSAPVRVTRKGRAVA